ncbi:MAG: hypothetical protein ISS17_06125 [Bacteroidales bacterium]|nr:hypothetical protein [Bacteroidales bacterium]
MNQELQDLIEHSGTLSWISPGEGFSDLVMRRFEIRRKETRSITGFIRSHSSHFLVSIAILVNLVSISFALRSIFHEETTQASVTASFTEVYYIDPSDCQVYTYFK